MGTPLIEPTCPEEPADCPSQEQPARAAAPLAIEVYGPDARPNGFERLAAEWNPLLQRSRYRTLFLTHEWQTTWWEHLGEGDLWILAFRAQETGRLVGIAPLYLVPIAQGERAGTRQLNIVGCIEVSDYLDLIIDQEWEEPVYRAFAAWLQSPDAPAFDLLDLCNLPDDSRTHTLLPPLLKADGWSVRVFQEDTAPQFELPFHYDTYLNERVEKKQRHEIRRKQRRAEREATVGFYIVGKEQSLEVEVDDFIALQRASRSEKAEFMTPPMRRFFHAAARALHDAGWLRLCFLTLNGEKAAALFAFEYDRRFLLYNSGYDPTAAHAHLSPGWVIVSYAIQYAIAVGNSHFDFMQGDEAYKYYFGAQDYRVMRVIAGRP